MLARLWWKEYRSFGPAWLILGLAAAGLQWILLMAGDDIRSGALTPAALAWAVLYAFAIGSAAFAGEREAGTLGFLDALPVDRRALWLGKTSFALASTLGLALILAGMAAAGTSTRDPGGWYGYGPVARIFGTLLFEAVAYGLFWSAWTSNPLPAGALAVATVGAVTALGNALIDGRGHPAMGEDLVVPGAVPYRLLLASAAMAASAAIFSRRARPGRPAREVDRAIGRDEGRSSRSSAARRLDWQAWREGRGAWILVGVVGLTVPVGAAAAAARSEGLIELLLAVAAALAAGVSVFGPENASGTRRFLLHHGAGPGLVWGRKLLIWGAGMAAFLGVFLATFLRSGSPIGPGPLGGPVVPIFQGLPIAAIVLDAFGAGVVCGMAIPRRITAMLVGVIGIVVLVPIQVGLASVGMVPPWALLLTPAILLAASRAWAGDWLAGPEGARPWARLGLLLVVPFGMLVLAHVATRAWGVPDVGPLLGPADADPGPFPTGQDAADAYRRAFAEYRPGEGVVETGHGSIALPVDEVIEHGWDPAQAEVVARWRDNRAAVDLAREASAMPGARFNGEVPRHIFTTDEPIIQGIRSLAQLLALDARERLSRGDLAGAWDDILGQLRMARHLTMSSPTLLQMLISARIRHHAVGLAFDWAADPRQAPESIRKARDDLKRLPPFPTIATALRVESGTLDRTLGLPADDLIRLLVAGSNSRPRTLDYLLARLLAPPWERIRARRICRLALADMVRVAGQQPWLRSDEEVARLDRPDPGAETSPLARMILPGVWSAVGAVDREAPRLPALELALAIRSWQFGHDGEPPGTLEDLVPAELDRLPVDPFSGRPFGYVRSEGQPLRPPILPDGGPLTDRRPTRPGQPLIYSVGPDRKDDRGMIPFKFSSGGRGDLVYPVP